MKNNTFTIVEDIKFEIQDKTGIPWEAIKLYVEWFELDDKLSFIEYGVPLLFMIKVVIQTLSKENRCIKVRSQ